MREGHNYRKESDNTLLQLSDRLIFPFSTSIPTSGALFFKILKQYSIPRNTFYVSPDPYGKHSARTSLVEREFFHCMRVLGPETGVDGADKGVRTQVRFRRQTVDGYVEETGTCFNFHGCEEHVHRDCEVRGKGNGLKLIVKQISGTKSRRETGWCTTPAGKSSRGPKKPPLPPPRKSRGELGRKEKGHNSYYSVCFIFQNHFLEQP